uniref:Cadherin domain-containing protein n=1 Tax=Timema cristinae TaxID=61476 RepID=A0A7R9GPZ2_TIMCR|nr:unnamed protein product [Timema cristinae]
MFRIERSSGEIFVSKPAQLSTRSRSTYHLNVSVTDGGGLRAPQDAEVFLNVVDPSQTSPVFERTRYSFSVREDVNKGTGIGACQGHGDGFRSVSSLIEVYHKNQIVSERERGGGRVVRWYATQQKGKSKELSEGRIFPT